MIKLKIAIADNVFIGTPQECHRHVLNELIKWGHTIYFYSYDTDNEKRMADFKAFLESMKIEGLATETTERSEIVAEIYYDERNLGGKIGIEHLFAMFLVSGLLPENQANLQLAQDVGFWSTGKRSSGIITNTAFKLN